MIRTVILAVNDEGLESQRVKESILEIRKLLNPEYFFEAEVLTVSDQQALIRSMLRKLSEQNNVDLILTTGGTGMMIKERAPEATKEVIEREVPGLAEYMRIVGMRHSPRSLLFRGVAGVRHRTLIVNLPGGPKGVKDSLGAIIPAIIPAVEYLLEHKQVIPEVFHS
ncbi:MAG TPA: MogA/MoaB family molybdenum cofactor biosynthesis protein [Trueperaceae bacterium]|nr:MogA/MoaB family molybdenum cofactor biosynthesis protein [Trueperaceae bacterium]